jgi:hypothetical protein
METLAPLRPRGLGWLALPVALVLWASVASANEVSGHGAAPGIVVHDVEETMRDYVREMDGAVWLVLPDGMRFELVTSTSDPAIANPGDGAFHPFDRTEVDATLHGLKYSLASTSAEIFLLPYPRRTALESAAGPGLILLSPGVRPLSREQQHAELTHELGHVVQYARMPDASQEQWAAYRKLRGIEDPAEFSSSAPHASRPHEIFAEDFRALFGDPLATSTGTIENASLSYPDQVSGLREFLLELSGTSTTSALRAFPNPARGAVRFAAPSTAVAAVSTLDLYDLAGRRVASLAPTAVAGRIEWSWDGLDATGRSLPSGMLLARVRGASGPALRITRLP